MKYIVETDKSLQQAATDLEAAVKRHGFGILHVYDLRQTLQNKGFELSQGCLIYEICNPRQAVEVLNDDMSLNMALPCRISVYEENGKTRIGMIKPSALLGLLSESAALATVADEVEQQTTRMIDEAV